MKKNLVPWLFALTTSMLLAGCASAPAETELLEVMPINSFSLSGVAPLSPSVAMPSGGTDDTSGTTPRENEVQEETEMKCLETLLQTALLPLGETAYVWGGGWNEEDTGAGTEARSLGVSPNWKAYADALSSDYDHKKHRYQIHDGLDCSGYVGWVIYNVFETSDDEEGYVYQSTDVAKTYASFGWGDYSPKGSVADWAPGDVASMNGHVWISLGTCDDGSVLLIHSSPPGVRLCGTLLAGKPSEATKLAEDLMRSHFPSWFERFPECSVKENYLSGSSRMRWNEETLPDAKAVQSMTAGEIAELLFH